jgi:disulfide bond formation protein DsbB
MRQLNQETTMPLPSPRQLFLLIALAVIGLMAYGLYSQHVDGLEPCPLCMTQRIFYCLTGAIALLAVIHNAKGFGHKVYASLMLVSSALGAAAAGRQVWLQHLPPEQVPACGPGLEYMLQTFPMADVLSTMIRGDGNCAEVVWQFLGLSMPEWSLIWFAGFMGSAIWLLFRKPV